MLLLKKPLHFWIKLYFSSIFSTYFFRVYNCHCIHIPFFQLVTQEPRDDSQQKLELEKLNGELSNAKQEIKNLQSDLKLVEEDKIQQRIMKGKLDKFARMEKQIESLRIENKLLNDTADNSQLLKEQVCEIG